MADTIVCPCCGFKSSASDVQSECSSCGASPVGPPLALPLEMLPSYGAALATSGFAALMMAVFGVSVVVALRELKALTTAGIGDWLAAAQIAAWRLKFILPPLSIALVWLGWRANLRIRRAPAGLYAGARLNYGGMTMALAVLLLFGVFIGTTIPKRLEQRRLAAQARKEALAYAFNRIQIQYRIRYNTYPTDKDDLLTKLPDPDGSIAAVLAQVPFDGYNVSSEKASLPVAQTRKMRGVRLQQISLRVNTDEPPSESISFTNYTMRLPGEDNLLNTDDDLVIRDGIILDAGQATPSADAVIGAPVRDTLSRDTDATRVSKSADAPR